VRLSCIIACLGTLLSCMQMECQLTEGAQPFPQAPRPKPQLLAPQLQLLGHRKLKALAVLLPQALKKAQAMVKWQPQLPAEPRAQAGGTLAWLLLQPPLPRSRWCDGEPEHVRFACIRVRVRPGSEALQCSISMQQFLSAL
jgi:hypothetical protein